jgi:hypothetical protein
MNFIRSVDTWSIQLRITDFNPLKLANQPTNQPKTLLRAESYASARRGPLLDYTIPMYETQCSDWEINLKDSNGHVLTLTGLSKLKASIYSH